MNYFAHGYDHVQEPYFLAGTAVPEWLSVVDRRVRARARLARPWVQDADPRRAALAAGVVRHHDDDRWFHRTRAFAELSLELTVLAREQLAGDPGFRPSFLGHILVEILLDAALIERDVRRLDQYYAALAVIDPNLVARAVALMTTGPAPGLAGLICLFCRERFLYDYLDDAKLLLRLNRVMRRVRLRPLPATILAALPGARQRVRQRAGELLTDDSEPGNAGERT
ncbi:MAG: hypothetical protein MUF48_09205 [Pirellulaceae bacterium]|jgi:hypothetical protein|nr:hypothetical protein [Pirellulaceae bacterium]